MKKTNIKLAQLVPTAITAALLSAGFMALQSPAAAQSSGPVVQNASEIRYVKGRLLVQPRAGLSLQEFDKKLKVHGARRVGTIAKINVHIVQLPAQASEQAVAQALRADRHIKFAELDQQVAPSFTPNDPSYTSGWHLPKIGAPTAWDYSSGGGVTVAILDSGVDPTHPDLQASLVSGYNAYDNNTDTHDVYGHGTKVAGSAAMVGDNLVGGTGVAFKARIMPIRVTSLDGYGNWSAMANGIIWAADHGARVANLSFQQSCGSATLASAAQYMRNLGGVVTISAGNSGTLEYMAPSDAITCVAATDSSDSWASWSSYGNFVDVAAPGVGIYTTTNGGGYGSVSGTSFSAPITAGVYALMMTANPSLSPAQLDDALFSTALDLGTGGYDQYFGYGRVDAAAAVAKVQATSSADSVPPGVAITSPGDGSSVSGLVAIDANASDNIGVARVDFYAGGRLLASEKAAPYAFSWDSSSAADGQVSLEARAFDAAGNMASSSIAVNVANTTAGTVNTTTSGGDTVVPTVAIQSPASGATITGATTISASGSDNNQVVKMNLAINGAQVAASSGSTLTYSWDPFKAMKGKGRLRNSAVVYTISATATDAAGNSGTASINVFVQQ